MVVINKQRLLGLVIFLALLLLLFVLILLRIKQANNPSNLPVAPQAQTTLALQPKALPASKQIVVQKKQFTPGEARANQALMTANQSNGERRYRIQVATFQHKANAKHLVEKLARQQFKASIEKKMIKQSNYWRVILKQVYDQTQAQSIKAKLAATLHLKSLIIADPS